METDTMSFCFNNRDGNVEIKCWWSRLSDLCYLIDKASLSELQSVKGDRITKMVVGWHLKTSLKVSHYVCRG